MNHPYPLHLEQFGHQLLDVGLHLTLKRANLLDEHGYDCSKNLPSCFRVAAFQAKPVGGELFDQRFADSAQALKLFYVCHWLKASEFGIGKHRLGNVLGVDKVALCASPLTTVLTGQAWADIDNFVPLPEQAAAQRSSKGVVGSFNSTDLVGVVLKPSLKAD